jgi:hypothetical protein
MCYRLKYVLWCLSNGEEWIFGAFNDKKNSRSLPSMFIQDDVLESSLKRILEMLVIWVSEYQTPVFMHDYLTAAKLDCMSSGRDSQNVGNVAIPLQDRR